MQQRKNHTANERGVATMTRFFIASIIVAGVVYSEILFLGIIGDMFPSGVMQAGAVIGALTTGASVLTLCIGKSHTFRPGVQMYAAWGFTFTEIGVLIMNDVLAYSLHNHSQDQWLLVWKQFCPAAPVLSIVGWVVIVFLNPERAIRHHRMEMEDEVESSEIDFQRQLHQIHMDAKKQAMSDMGSHLADTIKQEAQEALRFGARKMGAQIVSHLTDSAEVQLGGPRVVEADPVRPALAASKDQVLDPHQVKTQVDNEVKPLGKPSIVDRIWAARDAIDAKLDAPKRPAVITDDRPVVENSNEDDSNESESLSDDPADWTDEQWKQYQSEVDAWAFEDVWKMYRGDEPIPGTTPAKKKGKSKKTGQSGRLNDELEYALKWIPWAEKGFPTKDCPWKNPYEMKKHRPKPEVEAQARRILGLE